MTKKRKKDTTKNLYEIDADLIVLKYIPKREEYPEDTEVSDMD